MRNIIIVSFLWIMMSCSTHRTFIGLDNSTGYKEGELAIGDKILITPFIESSSGSFRFEGYYREQLFKLFCYVDSHKGFKYKMNIYSNFKQDPKNSLSFSKYFVVRLKKEIKDTARYKFRYKCYPENIIAVEAKGLDHPFFNRKGKYQAMYTILEVERVE
ncbi:MAG: hypothetical protein ACK5MD_09735 [Flavobacteriales bacterium]